MDSDYILLPVEKKKMFVFFFNENPVFFFTCEEDRNGSLSTPHPARPGGAPTPQRPWQEQK
jgi:hypothetical protein